MRIAPFAALREVQRSRSGGGVWSAGHGEAGQGMGSDIHVPSTAHVKVNPIVLKVSNIIRKVSELPLIEGCPAQLAIVALVVFLL
jgi:hypothetical protein